MWNYDPFMMLLIFIQNNFNRYNESFWIIIDFPDLDGLFCKVSSFQSIIITCYNLVLK